MPLKSVGLILIPFLMLAYDKMLEVIAVVHSTYISSVKLGDVKLDKLDLTTTIHSTSFTVITCDFFSSCWVG